MPLVISSSQFQAKLRWRFAGDSQEMISTLGVRKNGSSPGDPPATIADVNAIAEKVSKSWTEAFADSFMKVGWTFAGVEVISGRGGVGEDDTLVGSYNNFHVGADAAGTPPTNCAVLVRKLTGRGGKRGRGRMFLPPAYLDEAGVDGNGILSSGVLSAFGTCLDAFQTHLGTADADGDALDPLLFHWVPAAGAGPEADLITDFVCAPQIATQRQRMRR